MKIFLLILAASLSSITYGQTTKEPKPQSKIELFTEKSGTLVRKDFTDIGKLGKKEKVLVQVLTITDLINSTTINGLRLEYDSYSSLGSDTKTAFIDKDEMDGLIKSLSLIKEKITTPTTVAYTEIIFKSRSGFEAGCFSNQKKPWDVYLKLERFDNRSMVIFTAEELDQIIAVFQSGKEKL